MKLNDLKIRKLKPSEKPVRHSDGYGLYIEIKPNGSKLWKMAYRFDEKQKTLSFGRYPITTLAKARAHCLNAKTLLADGIDPSAHAKAEKAARKAKTEDTFEKIAAELLEKQTKDGLSPVTLKKKRWLLNIAIEDLGPRPISNLSLDRSYECNA